VRPVQKSNQEFFIVKLLTNPYFACFFSKVLERILVVNHFNSHNLFSIKQSGFRPGHSTQDVLLHVSDSWLGAIDTGQYVDAIFLLCVNHDTYFIAKTGSLWYKGRCILCRLSLRIKLPLEYGAWVT